MSLQRTDRQRPDFDGQKGNGYDDAALLAGRPLGSVVHLLVLAAAAAADYGQFYGVVKVVLPELTERMALMIVAGFTAVVLFLAHAAGATFRDRRAGVQWIRRPLPWLCVCGWLVLGAAAFYVRLAQQPDSVAGVIQREGEPAVPAAAGTELHLGPAAIVFVALYVATGLVAGIGGYLTHNPAHSAHLRARIAKALAARRAARAALAMQVANGNRELQESYQQKAVEVLRRESDRRLALAEELKQHARLVMAQRAKDPALTDALFEPDRNPYHPPRPPEA
ncbi:hypothetical protein FHU28_002365 [Micromonospora echinospora]|uniref:Uncharacterized protein n=1 Tax=Micromonospora echinospora TaxID=1877 RepID=A0ABR6MAW9_MICEC|nr:hypothetical protein [Micromonospora echinospora]MBB5112526.1 hypothetical protein [Micromonospora echinospora]